MQRANLQPAWVRVNKIPKNAFSIARSHCGFLAKATLARTIPSKTRVMVMQELRGAQEGCHVRA
jgi:hypothetical protein